MTKCILFINEGKDDEPRLMKRICQLYYGFKEQMIVNYYTPLYELMRLIHIGDRYPKDCDLLEVLEESKTATKKELFNGSYTDIYLIDGWDSVF
jgi:hypothetical protein